MIVTCDKDKLNGLVQTALRGISSRVTMPILTGLLVHVEDGKMVISSTDLEMSIRAEMEVTVKESGSTVVSGRLLGDVTKSLPSGEVSIETGDRFLTVKAKVGEFKITEMQPEDFPQIPQWEGDSVIKIGGGAFLVAVQQTSRASSSDEKRPVLTGTLLESADGGGFRMVTTDSYRLAWRELDVAGTASEWDDCIIPTRTLNEVARIAGASEGDIEIKMQDKQVMFKVEELSVSSRLIEGQFPNYKQLVPKGERTGVKVAKEEMISALKRATVFGHNLRFGVYGDHVRITAETPERGASKEDIPAEVTGEEMEIGFNATYMLDGVTAVETEKVELRFDDPQKPAVLKNDDSEGYTYILMPVRLR